MQCAHHGGGLSVERDADADGEAVGVEDVQSDGGGDFGRRAAVGEGRGEEGVGGVGGGE